MQRPQVPSSDLSHLHGELTVQACGEMVGRRGGGARSHLTVFSLRMSERKPPFHSWAMLWTTCQGVQTCHTVSNWPSLKCLFLALLQTVRNWNKWLKIIFLAVTGETPECPSQHPDTLNTSSWTLKRKSECQVPKTYHGCRACVNLAHWYSQLSLFIS